MPYLLDANAFIQAKNLWYGFDFCPAYWDWIIQKNREDVVFSIEKVSNELDAGDDDLTLWARELDEGFFLIPDKQMVSALGPVSEWAMGQDYQDTAINTFMQVADFHLIAHAYAHGHTVVTHERLSDSKKNIKIPNACNALGIKCMNPFEMLRKEKARFILSDRL